MQTLSVGTFESGLRLALIGRSGCLPWYFCQYPPLLFWVRWLISLSSLTTQAYLLAYFLPIILRENMSFSIEESQMLTALPYAGAAIVMFICAWIGDRYYIRGPLLLFTAALGLTGLPLLVRPD